MRRKLWKRLTAAALAAALILALAGCGAGAGGSKSDASLQKVLNAGQLILGLDAAFPPMGFTDASGEIVGFDIDVAQEVCDRLGVTLVKKAINWDNKEAELNDGTIDCIWNGMSITPARADVMCLSEPYMKNELIFVVPGSSDIRTLRDLSGRIIGAQAGSTAQEVLEASAFYADNSAVLFDTAQELLQRLEQGEVDTALVDSVAAFYFIFSNEDPFYVLPDSLAEEDYAIGFRKGDLTLRDRVQELIGEMKADGTLGNISNNRLHISTVSCKCL